VKVELRNLTKVFSNANRNQEPVTAVNNVSLTIPEGTLVGLLGPSGCGKSTTLNLLSGLLTPTEGQIFFGEEDVTQIPAEKRGVGLVFQNYALYPHLTVRDNILFPLQNIPRAQRPGKKELLKKVEQAARLVQIESLLDRKPAALSGGQQQRVAIARALVKMPRILLLDEPLSNLDARLRLQTREELRRIQRETGITTVFVTHDQEEAMSISDLIAVMQNGIVQQVGKPQDVYDDPCNLFVAKFLGTPPIHVFSGRVRNSTLFLGSEAVLPYAVPDGEYKVAIRPEAFEPNETGALTLRFSEVEVMGRDITVVATHEACENSEIRAIISADTQMQPADGTVRFDLKPKKVFLFDRESGLRVRPTL